MDREPSHALQELSPRAATLREFSFKGSFKDFFRHGSFDAVVAGAPFLKNVEFRRMWLENETIPELNLFASNAVDCFSKCPYLRQLKISASNYIPNADQLSNIAIIAHICARRRREQGPRLSVTVFRHDYVA